MSSGSPTGPSPFVRSTKDAHVYFLQAGVRRLIPDSATLAFMTAGQQVRTITDAEMQAIKLGTPMPSRATGQLLRARVPILSALRPVYVMSRGLRRIIPDDQTLNGFVSHGSAVHEIDGADVDLIPEGPPLPSRADRTLYRAPGAFAFLMEGGKKRAVPDFTTLSALDISPSAPLLPISGADLQDIPTGDPFPSTSRFLHPPSSSIPLVLLPVRLETRFQGSDLLVRIYPDDIHINSFEPELTADESDARAAFQAQAQTGSAAARDGFASLARKFGPERAAWIASAGAQPGTKADQWTKAPFTDVLPERWIILGYQTTESSGQVLGVGSPIADSLPVGPAPGGPGPSTDPGMRWVADFNAAVAAGMALRIPLTGAQTRGFKRIVAIGLRSGLAPADAVKRLSALLEAHHYTDGLELLPHGAPTNNTEDVKSGLATKDPGFASLFALEKGPALCPSRPTADGDRVARALGVKPGLFAHVNGANGAQDEQARAINTVLWPATWGYYLQQIVTGSVPDPDTILPAARAHFIEHVRARGHFPILRIGRQPYGLLPVLWTVAWSSLEGRALDLPLASLLAQLRAKFQASLANVPRIPGASDPESSLVEVLGMGPTSANYAVRAVLGPEFNLSFWKFAQQDIGKAWWNTLASKSLAGAGGLAATLVNTRLTNATFVPDHRPLSDLMVAPAPLDGVPAPAFIAKMATLGWIAIRDFAMPAPPVPLLLLLLRHAALRQFVDTAGQLLGAAGAVEPAERLEPELVGLSAAIKTRPTPWAILQRTLPGKGPVGAFLDGAKKNTTIPDFAEFWTAFNKLATLTAEALDFATREVLDLASYRFDAWVTSLAHFRLDQTRVAAPNGGLVLGGYGWVEDVVPEPKGDSAGYIHAPSLEHASTAAVLRSGFLAHKNGSPQAQAMQIDLSSDRVRLGLHLLDGIRTGQPLGALLGYRLERSLHDAGLDQFIDDLRTVAPLDGAIDDVVDGLQLLRRFHSDPNFWSAAPGLPKDVATQTKLAAVIGRLDDALDAVADLATSESVHQLIRGNTIRAGATVDAIARGDVVPPPDLDIVRTPRSGTSFTHRLFAIAVDGTAPGWTNTPRAKAEPRLNSWAATLLGAPSRVRARATFSDAKGTSVGPIEFSLDKLALAPLDLLAIPESGIVGGELGDRLLRVAAGARPSSVPATSTVSLVMERNPTWTPDIVAITEFMDLVWAVARVARASRALEPRDLVRAGDPATGGIDLADLQSRADGAEAALRAGAAPLGSSAAFDTALLGAAAFGVPGSVPKLDPSLWPAQAASASAELAQRIGVLTGLATGFDRASASPDQARDHDVARLRAAFGDSFVVLPALAPALAAVWPQIWGNGTALQAGDSLAVQRWFSRAARVRPGAARLDKALLYAEALAGKTVARFDLAQLPFTAGDRWVALDLPKTGPPPSSRLSMVAFSPVAFTPGQSVAGMVVDDWVEVLPNTQQITGVSFHHDEPAARAPHAILLGVRPDSFPEWTLESLEGTVLEALSLAQFRAVDPDALTDLGHFLPALYFAFNSGAPQVETVSTDFNLALRATPPRNI